MPSTMSLGKISGGDVKQKIDVKLYVHLTPGLSSNPVDVYTCASAGSVRLLPDLTCYPGYAHLLHMALTIHPPNILIK